MQKYALSLFPPNIPAIKNINARCEGRERVEGMRYLSRTNGKR